MDGPAYEQPLSPDDALARYVTTYENQILSEPNAVVWARMDYWRIWEALLLVNGYYPSYFEQRLRYRDRDASALAQVLNTAQRTPVQLAMFDYCPTWGKRSFDHMNMCDVLERSSRFAGDIVAPSEFLAWVKEKNFVIHPPLEEAVKKIWGPLPTWGHEDVERLDDQGSVVGTKREGPKWVYVRKRDALAESLPANSLPTNAELLPKERDSLLKLVIGMAMEQYNYDPKADRNDATKNIETDLMNAGVALDRGTILKWLRAAAATLDNK